LIRCRVDEDLDMTADFQSGGRADRLCLMAVDPQPDQWWLDDPLPSIDSWPFRRGERVGPPGDVRIAVAEEGRPLDITLHGFIVVVAEWVGSLIAALRAHE